jgi:ABC-2 type transport system ATP-binding protein
MDDDSRRSDPTPGEQTVSVVVEDYHKVYGGTVAVAGISFTVEPGEVLGLVGPNGAGKTTTLRALAGILAPTRGRIVIDGHDLGLEPVAAKAALAYVPDDPKLFLNLTVWEHLQFSAAAYRLDGDWETRAEGLLARFELREKREALASELSRGMRQKLAIGCGLLHNPRVILLDEPMTGLDPHGIRTMKDAVREHAGEGAAVLVSSHMLSLVEDLCTSVLMMHRGRVLLRGRLADLHHQAQEEGRSETLEELFLRLTRPDESESAAEAPATHGGARQ